MSLDALPTELYSAILFHVPAESLQQTVLSLTRTIPSSPVPFHLLFHSIRITHPDQAVQLHRRLRADTSNSHEGDRLDSASSWVYRFSLETWQADADVLINLIHLLPNLESLTVWIGPNNFAPDHLEEMFSKHMPRLKRLSLRFRPYVQKPTYFQFLKGAYFDSTLLALSAWPPSSHGLPMVSIIQDPFTPAPSLIEPRVFAQPIIFFQLDPNLSRLVHSPIASTFLKFLRVRIPARPIVQPLTTHTNATPAVLSSVELLDISTCRVNESDIDILFVRSEGLKHLIMDACPALLRGASGPAIGQELGWWSALGRRCALAGVKRAEKREKELKGWLEARSNVNLGGASNTPGVIGTGRPRRGRRGLATATISLRTATSPPAAATLVSPSSAVASEPTSGRRPAPPIKIRIIPPLPTLLSLSIYPTMIMFNPIVIEPGARALVRAEFVKGWRDGIRILWDRRGRIGADFARNVRANSRVRFMKFKDGDTGGAEEEGLEGLEDVKEGEESIFFDAADGAGTVNVKNAPVLCVAGPGRKADGHVDGCGHSVAWDIWADEL